jgi:outer membrane receptor protein involved in Fe transport
MLRLIRGPLAAFGLIFLLALSADAQPPVGGRGDGMPSGTVTGAVIDESTEKPIEYATIVLFNSSDSSQVTGTVTDVDGEFVIGGLRPGRYYARVGFIGFNRTDIDSISVMPRRGVTDLGTVLLTQAALEMEEVDYVVDRAPVEFQIDKKIVRVSKQPTVASGTAVDVLENVPSVNVDIEGNVELRGSGNFRVLIDGRPTIMDANDALQQTSASSIENIEIITNPSAKYDPEGTAGIINIILKKNVHSQTSALASASYGSFGQKSADAQVSFRLDGFRFLVGADYGERDFEGTTNSTTITTVNGVSSTTRTKGDRTRGHSSGGVRASVEYDINKRNWIAVGTRWGVHSFGGDSELDYITSIDSIAGTSEYTSLNDRGRDSQHGNVYTEYRHTFGLEDHVLAGRIQQSWRSGDEETYAEQFLSSGERDEGRRTTEWGPSEEIELRLDYTVPFSEEAKLESGYEMEIDESSENTGLWEYTNTNGYVYRPEFSHATEYDRTIQSAWLVYSNKWNKFGYQLGARGEYTDREIILTETGDNYVVDRQEVYPSLHFSYQLPKRRQLMASYSRRIDRPRSWYLEPFETWMDPYNVRTGNPALEPELIDSYELGFQMPVGPFMHSTEVYYRVTHDHVERVRSVYDQGITLHSIANVGTRYALGAEVMFSGDLVRWWNVNLMGNFFQDRVETNGLIPGADAEQFSWSSRFNNTFKLNPKTKVQASVMYRSPMVSTQSEREAFFVTNLAFERSFFDKSLTAILQVRDVFSTMEFSSITKAAGLYSDRYFEVSSPLINFTIRYNFHNYRERRQPNGGDGMDGGGDEDGGFM